MNRYNYDENGKYIGCSEKVGNWWLNYDNHGNYIGKEEYM